jgi:hypothetical protein
VVSRLVRWAFRYALEANHALSWLLEVRSEYRWRRAMRASGYFRVVPYSPRELRLYRDLIRNHYALYEIGFFTECEGEFTCDDCNIACWCTLVYDAYNTNGDCLLSK